MHDGGIETGNTPDVPTKWDTALLTIIHSDSD